MIKYYKYLNYSLVLLVVYFIFIASCKQEPALAPTISSLKPPPTEKELAREAAIVRAQKFEEEERIRKAEEEANKSRWKKKWQHLYASPVFRGKGKMLDHINDPVGSVGARYPKLVWLEALAPHYPADLLIDAFKEWEGTESITKDFIDWLQEVYIPREQQSEDSERVKAAEKLLRSRVVWLDEIDRRTKRITIKNGLLYDYSKNVFHTGNLKTVQSGEGAAIFVLGRGNILYAGSHGTKVDGRDAYTHFLHASFLAGARTLAAGEIGVDRGKVIWITLKSGHYKPNTGEILYFLEWLKRNGIDLTTVAVVTEWRTYSYNRYYNAAEVLLKNGINLGPEDEVTAPPKILPYK